MCGRAKEGLCQALPGAVPLWRVALTVAGLGGSADQMGKCLFNKEAGGEVRMKLSAIGLNIFIGTIGLLCYA